MLVKKSKTVRRKHKDSAESIRLGDLVEIIWQDVILEDKACRANVKPPFDFDPTTNIGRVVYRGKKLRKDWLIIASEIPHDASSPGAVTTAFPSGVLSTSKIRLVERWVPPKEV